MPTTTPFNNLITFSRGSNATVTGPNGLIQWAPNNLLTFSEQFDNAAWTKTNATVYPNQDFGNGTLGPELETDSWSAPPVGVSYDGSGTFTFDGTTSQSNTVFSTNTPSASIVAGRVYLVTFTIFGNTTQPVGIDVGGTLGAAQTAAGTYREYLVAASSTGPQARFRNTVGARTGSIGNISVREITPAVATAPDGTQTADTLVENTATGEHAVNATTSISIPAGTSTFSTYLKAGGRDWVVLNFAIASGSLSTFDARAWFNLSTGVVGTTASGAVASITPVGSGWYRCSITATFGATANRRPYVALADADGSYSYAGNGTSGILIWGAQLELGSTATTYNSTTVKNLLGFSEAFDNAAWAKSNASIVTGAQANPVNGLFNAQKLMEDTANAGHFINQLVTTIAGTSYTASVYLKAAGRNARLFVYQSASPFTTIGSITVDLSNGAVLSGSGTVVNVGSGWYRVSVTGAAIDTATRVRVDLAQGATFTYTGDGNSGVYIYGAQLSDSASLDPYVPTPGAAPSSTAFYGPRFDFDPVTLLPRGLLVEEQRTNLLTYSDDFGNATGWPTVTNVTITANATASPDGTVNADRFDDGTTASVQHRIFRSFTFTAAAHTYSVFVKAGTGAWFQLVASDGTTVFYANFNAATGALGNRQAATTSTITNVGNGWYRCTMTATTAAAAGNAQIGMLDTDAPLTLPSFTGANRTLFFYGAQLEAGAFATSYIPTVASTVTRSADVATITGQNFAQWFGQAEGTFVADVLDNAAGVNVLVASDGTTTNQLIMASSTLNIFSVFTGGAFQAQLGVTPPAPYKTAGAYKVNDFAAAANGGTVSTDTSGALATYSRLSIGTNAVGNAAFLNGHIRNIRFIPARAADFQLQGLST